MQTLQTEKPAVVHMTAGAAAEVKVVGAAPQHSW